MPELPDVTVYVECLQTRIVGQPLVRVRLGSPFVLRSVTPSLADAESREVRGVSRLGKRIVIALERNLSLVIHLMTASPIILDGGRSVLTHSRKATWRSLWTPVGRGIGYPLGRMRLSVDRAVRGRPARGPSDLARSRYRGPRGTESQRRIAGTLRVGLLAAQAQWPGRCSGSRGTCRLEVGLR